MCCGRAKLSWRRRHDIVKEGFFRLAICCRDRAVLEMKILRAIILLFSVKSFLISINSEYARPFGL